MNPDDEFTIARTISYSVTEAELVLGGYAFAREGADYRRDQPTVPGVEPAHGRRHRWAYRTYDCIPAGPGPRVSDLDLFAAIGLNSRQEARSIASLLLVRDELSDCLDELEGCLPFWEQNATELFGEESRLIEYSVGWWMYRAWALLMGARDIDVAVTHKLLHHKRPDLFPLLDRQTKRVIGEGGRRWISIWRDLQESRSKFSYLENWFEREAAARGATRLTRLRIHDILVWCDAVGHRDSAVRAGSELQQEGRP